MGGAIQDIEYRDTARRTPLTYGSAGHVYVFFFTNDRKINRRRHAFTTGHLG